MKYHESSDLMTTSKDNNSLPSGAIYDNYLPFEQIICYGLMNSSLKLHWINFDITNSIKFRNKTSQIN